METSVLALGQTAGLLGRLQPFPRAQAAFHRQQSAAVDTIDWAVAAAAAAAFEQAVAVAFPHHRRDNGGGWALDWDLSAHQAIIIIFNLKSNLLWPAERRWIAVEIRQLHFA
jgi:hypothetical protein